MFQGIHSFEEVIIKVSDPTQRMLIHEAQKQLKFRVLEDKNRIFEQNERKTKEEMQAVSNVAETPPNIPKDEEHQKLEKKHGKQPITDPRPTSPLSKLNTLMQRSQDLKGKTAYTKSVYNVETFPKILPNISVKIERENKPSQRIHASIISDFIDLEKGHPDEVVDPTLVYP